MKTNQTAKLRFTISDLLTLVTLAAVSTLFLVYAWRAGFSPTKFANSLQYNTAAVTMIICSFGLVVFPALFATAGILFLRKTNLSLKIVFAGYMFLLAIVSVPVAYVIARSCAGAIGG